MNDEMVSHPPHYQTENGLECIDVIEAFTADLKGTEAFCTANIIKYICRQIMFISRDIFTIFKLRF